MQHIAFMKKSWKLTEKILSSEKTTESRWYKNKRPPWNQIKAGETIFFKNSGEPITIQAEVKKVIQFENLTPKKAKEIIDIYGKQLCADAVPNFYSMVKDKKYYILVFLKKPQKIEPFYIDKSGFGMMTAWICVEDVEKIKI